MSSIGPQIPAHLLPTASNNEEEEEDDDYTPALPPDLLATRTQPTSTSTSTSTPPESESQPQPPRQLRQPTAATPQPPRRTLGPSFPSSNPDDDSDDDVGPKPLPSWLVGEPETERSGVQEFLEREERLRLKAEEDKKPKKPVRDEWMLVPPKKGDLLGSLDPTKLKARQFARTAQPDRDASSSLWTETPAERQQRIADEVAGRKRRAVDVASSSKEEDDDARKRRRRDEEIRRGVEEHTRRSRGVALVDVHAKGKKGDGEDGDEDGEKPAGIWDHARDMSVGGRLMDDSQRRKMLADAKGLGERFGSGRSGGFL
ncbi:hypothetical protein BJ138DRAFT_1112154 [Hygrophoropsis aurantiaca]|uniref:Uncharacterized protein n=1 Tax=Hygrophoropsis aurantiaca TaxID=72124 RepID=A0ACB8AJG7_9AGAM|nr:hypothetical protein BJ138DRAFT_1112154 [Hygrophoropsis aurantiaca]